MTRWLRRSFAEPATSTRSGAALAAAVVVLLVIDCVVLGTLQLALLERRLADNAFATLRLRLAAQSAAHEAVARWPAALDDIARGETVDAEVEAYDRIRAGLSIERIGTALFTVRARAWSEATPHASAFAVLLVVPPLVHGAAVAGSAALVAHELELAGDGAIEAVPDACTPEDVQAALTADMGQAGTVEGAARPYDDAVARAIEVSHVIRGMGDSDPERLDAAAWAESPDPHGFRFLPGGATLDADWEGVIVVAGDAVVAAHGRGLLMAAGRVHIQPGGRVSGAVIAGGAARVEGHVALDACGVRKAAHAAGLLRPRLLPGRAVLPAF